MLNREEIFLYLPASFLSVTTMELCWSMELHRHHSLWSIFVPAMSKEDCFFSVSAFPACTFYFPGARLAQIDPAFVMVLPSAGLRIACTSGWAMQGRKEAWSLLITGTRAVPVPVAMSAETSGFLWGYAPSFSTEIFTAVLVERASSRAALSFFNLLSLYITSDMLDIKESVFLWWNNYFNILTYTTQTHIGSASLVLKIKLIVP